MGEQDTYNGDFTRPVHIVAAPFHDVAIQLRRINTGEYNHDESLGRLI